MTYELTKKDEALIMEMYLDILSCVGVSIAKHDYDPDDKKTVYIIYKTIESIYKQMKEEVDKR